ncbi:MAG: histidine phosphatase family protein [Alphaproteobacteria bacterium]|nr:histidine phosphatase family protein [Alphaproteobacteria bacterium]
MIYLIRHGEPSAGWGDHLDPGLSEKGLQQAEAAAETLARAGAKRAVTSPLARCRETARPFEKRIETHARIEPGVGEVRTPAGIGPEDRAGWLKGVMAGRWAEAGADLDAWRRAGLAALEQMPDDTAVFSHFVAINSLIGLLTGDDRVVIFRPSHCSITRLVRKGGKLAVAELGSEGALAAL